MTSQVCHQGAALQALSLEIGTGSLEGGCETVGPGARFDERSFDGGQLALGQFGSTASGSQLLPEDLDMLAVRDDLGLECFDLGAPLPQLVLPRRPLGDPQ